MVTAYQRGMCVAQVEAERSPHACIRMASRAPLDGERRAGCFFDDHSIGEDDVVHNEVLQRGIRRHDGGLDCRRQVRAAGVQSAGDRDDVDFIIDFDIKHLVAVVDGVFGGCNTGGQNPDADDITHRQR